MITLEQAKALSPGDILHHSTNRNTDSTCQRWKVNGKVKTWKRDSSRVLIPVKHGLRNYGYITEDELAMVNLENDCFFCKEVE